MSRLLSAVKLDLQLQRRYGFYFAAAFTSLMWIVLLRELPSELLGVTLPLVLFVDLAVVGFYFIAGTVLFEKGERALYALVVTPLRFREYLGSKLATLTGLAVIVSVTVVLATYGVGFNLPLVVLGVSLTSMLMLLVGFISVSPFSSISEYLIPSALYMVPLNLPLLHYLGLEGPILYLVPTQGSLLLLQAAFAPIEVWQLIYAVLYQLVWIGLLAWLARRAFDRWVVARGGEG